MLCSFKIVYNQQSKSNAKCKETHDLALTAAVGKRCTYPRGVCFKIIKLLILLFASLIFPPFSRKRRSTHSIFEIDRLWIHSIRCHFELSSGIQSEIYIQYFKFYKMNSESYMIREWVLHHHPSLLLFPFLFSIFALLGALLISRDLVTQYIKR